MDQRASVATPGAAFQEGFVDADGFRIRYRESGQGDALISLHGAGGLRLYTSHELLARQYRVIVFEVPGFGESPANERSQSMQQLALTMAQAATNLGLESFNLMGNSFGGKLALWLAVQQPHLVQALVLVAPAAIRPEGAAPPWDMTPEERMARLYAHPERQPASPPPDPALVEKQYSLVQRVLGPPRDDELENRLADLNVPVLVVFGTEDRMIPPEMGHVYCQKLPNCHLMLVYDAGHEVDADRPEAFATMVDDFLQRHEGFVVQTQSSLINP